MKAGPLQTMPPAYAEENREATIIVAESSAVQGGELVEQLRADRYGAALARTTEHARSLARSQPIRAIVLGALEPPRGALELLEEVRSDTAGALWDERLPAIVVCAGADQLDLLRAFEAGADDFIATDGPVYLELRARLRALLRRAEGNTDTRLLCVGPLAIDTAAHDVRVDGASVELSRLEYELLVYLARSPTGVCSKQELLGAIWNQRAGPARTVDSHASRLRRKLDSAGAGSMVVNVWGVGYRLL
ncbi:MAG TPA: response regulator transcription factor [Solirubrobacteraceae bacterium]|nr:response regulator transcription factor [Solirubrobacteraceae bacterium]